jgi:hypothetical protein
MLTRHANKLDANCSRSTAPRVFSAGVLLVVLLLCIFWTAAPAYAAFTFPLTQTFKNYSAPGWVFGGSPSPYKATLTGGTAITNPDPANNGWLRLTSTTGYQAGYAYYDTPIPTGRGLVITFDYGAWGGTGADGLSFFLFDGVTPTFNVGASGGSLGYAQKTGVNGLSGGYLGLGLDEFGNFPTRTKAV